MKQTDFFPEMERTLTTEERLEKIREVKAAVAEMTFATDLCRAGNMAWPRHADKWGRCTRCGSPTPSLTLNPKNK